MDQSISLDILAAKMQNPLLTILQEEQFVKAASAEIVMVISANFNMFAEKYLLLKNVSDSCQQKIINTMDKSIAEVTAVCDKFIQSLRQQKEHIHSYLFQNADLDEATKIIEKTYSITSEDLSQEGIDWLVEQFKDPKARKQQDLSKQITQKTSLLVAILEESHQNQCYLYKQMQYSLNQLISENMFKEGIESLRNQEKYWQNKNHNAYQMYKEFTGEGDIQTTRPENKQQLIDQLLKVRQLTSSLMFEHQIKHKHGQVKGGGSFGYSWTHGYGIKGTKFDELTLNKSCKECMVMNHDMHSSCKQLYDMDFRDKGVWWVVAWFLYE